MTSEIRVNKIENRSGLGTVTFADTGVDLAGIVTATTFSGSGASLTSLPAANITGTLPAISAANLTNVPAANITGTLPAISAANLTNVPAANLTGILPALNAASLTSIPAANIVGVCTSGLTKTGGFGGIKQADQWRLSSNFDATGAYITSNWERNDTDFAYVGDGITESSGVFTFPETGIYLIMGQFRAHGLGSSASYVGCDIHCTTNNSDYTNRADSYDSQGFTNGYTTGSTQCFFDVTDTSTHKVKMYVSAASSHRFSGNSNKNNTSLTFIRLGDT